MSGHLPVADQSAVRRAAFGELRADRPAVTLLLVLNVLAVAAGLVGPRLLGEIVDSVNSIASGSGSAPGSGSASADSASRHALVAHIDRLALTIVAFTILQIILSRYASYVGSRFGARSAARIRERFHDRTLALPASVAEHAAAGDLVTRGANDTVAVAGAMRSAVPAVFVAGLQTLFIIGAVVLLNPLLGVSGLISLAVLTVVVRWYLRRARAAYLTEGAANSAIAEVLGTTAAGARTVEALGLQERRLRAADDAIADARRARMRTLWLRSVLFPSLYVSESLPIVGVLLIGGVLYDHGVVSLGAVVASLIYLRQLAGPLETILIWTEQLQSSAASFARVEGLADLAVREVPGASRPAEPADDRIEVADVTFAYGTGHHDVLHGVDLDIRPGERLAVVGPSGAGKSTLGRLLAGIDQPRTGTVTVGGVRVADLAPDRLRRQVVLVTQEHHVFHDSVRDNLLLAKPDATDAEVLAALAAVDASWIDDLPVGLDTQVGGSGHRLDGAQAQQLALARVVLADPHTLILDEATALLDPASARNAERALAAVLEGRTVVAIAHRLQTAHDADRVAVMASGVVAELGTHDDLVAAGGAYAALWHSWHGAERC